jgi:hypothetical protein
VASNLWGDLLGAEIAVKSWFKSPRGVATLWAGILGGPAAWTLQFLVNYPVSSLSCVPQYRSQHPVVFVATTLGALATTMVCAFLAWGALQRTPEESTTEGGKPWDRTRFMALLGLFTCGLFTAVIVATALPPWMLKNVCN